MSTPKRYREDSLDGLLPGFRPVVERILGRMSALGFDCVVFDALRTPEEALQNAAKGTGIVNSIHCYGAAVDIICNRHGWSCKAKRCKFYLALQRCAEAEGCVSGAHFKSVDLPHVQAVPVGTWQNRVRACGLGNVEAANAVVLAYRRTLPKVA